MPPLRLLRIAWGFLTGLPGGAVAGSAAELAASLGFFPAVGFILGAGLWAADLVLPERLSAGVTGVLLAALLGAATRGLHLDGVADCADGLSAGHRGRERMLAAMRDSRIGAHGAAALTFIILLKAALLTEVSGRNLGWALLVFPAVGRAVAVLLMLRMPYARAEGIARPFFDHPAGNAGAAALAALGAAAIVNGVPGFMGVLAAAALAYALARHVQARIGGLTGDVYGAAIELTECAFLAVVIAA